MALVTWFDPRVPARPRNGRIRWRRELGSTLAARRLGHVCIREQPLLRADVSNELDALLAKGDVDGAKAVCEASPCLVANITRAGLVRANPGSYDSEAV